MRNWLGGLLEQWREHHRQRRTATLDDLAARYHIFRTLLDSNNQAVELLTELDWRLRATAPAGERRQQVLRLVELTGDLVEKLNHLDDDRHRGLYGRQHRLAGRIRELLDQLPAPPPLPPCLELSEIRPEMLGAVGGKAAQLATLKNQQRFPVPDGFVITAQACRSFLEDDGLFLRLGGMLQRGRSEDEAFPAATIAAVQESIRHAPLPRELAEALARQAAPYFSAGKGVAVRSSAVAEDGRRHSFAGQFVTVLNVVNQTGLTEAFKQVVASSFNRRSLAYRLHAGLDPLDFDMAVLCLEMVPARAAGILLTQSPLPNHDGLLVSGVFGLGEAAVAGSSPADLYLLDPDGRLDVARSTIAEKSERLVCLPGGGLGSEVVVEAERRAPVLAPDQLATLAQWGQELAQAAGTPQDLEWASRDNGELVLLQVRPQVLGQDSPATIADPSGPALVSGGIRAAGGVATGRAHLVKRRQDLAELPTGPVILVMHQSLVDAVGVIDRVAGLLIDLGNPADHLALVARESGIPMVCGLGEATASLREGQWLTVDTERGAVLAASPAAIAAAESAPPRERPAPPPLDPLLAELRELIVPLNLTDAFGPTFVISECRSLHDLVRYIHEKGVLAMFNAGDAALEQGGVPVRILDSQVPFVVNLIDLGGGLEPELKPRRLVSPEVIRSLPFRALWEGIADPNLQWGPAEGGNGVGSVMSSFLTDHRSARPVGMPNYAIVSRDYLNLNARMDFHFAMVDAVCGLAPRSNYARFRFKGGGTTPLQRQRRALCIARILEAQGFYTDVRDDLVNGSLQGVPTPQLTEKLAMLGRLLGFTRLLDAVMKSEAMIDQVAQAFLAGDYRLEKQPGELRAEK
jgi:pyruvate,water dikinase